MKKQLGIVGMGVMGRSLARNWAKSGHSLSLYNRRVSGSEEGVALALSQQFDELRQAAAYEVLSDFVASLEQPRKIVLMVTAGPAVDDLIDELRPLLQSGDLIIDAGNAHYLDTERRMSMLKTYQVNMLGLGVSGGEQGALEGASLMAGGTPSAYALAEPFLKSIAAKTPAGQLALKHIGPGGSGHFVKMVHNAIEYAEMQAIAEAFEFMHSLMGLDYEKIAEVFEAWNDSSQQSYLLEISSRILRTKDDQGYVIERIADRAAYNQTGAATLVEGALKGEPLSMVASALFARFISSKKAQRQELSQYAERSAAKLSVSADELKQAYAFTRIINHYQHFEMISAFSDRLGWKVNLSDLCSVWSSGCIIRSTLLQQLMPKVDGQLSALFDKATREQLFAQKPSVKKVITAAIDNDLPLSSMQAALNYYQQMTQERSSAAMVQAQRDYFGAHGVYFKQSAETLTFYPWPK